jgi:hypothetical protein
MPQLALDAVAVDERGLKTGSLVSVIGHSGRLRATPF